MAGETGVFGLRLHHVGYIVRDVAAACVSYADRFGYRIETAPVHDPLQTAVVQFLRLPGDSAYLELVAPDGPESKLAAAVGRRGGMHHVCYTCGPLEPAAALLGERGMLLFEPPKPAIAFAGRRICWLIGDDGVLVELVERRDDADPCRPQ